MARSSSKNTTAPVTQQTENSAKLDSIRMAMDQIEKQYGRGSIMRFGEVGNKLDISVVSTVVLPDASGP